MTSNNGRRFAGAMDEALAAEMQEQYRLDFIQRNTRKIHQARASAPTGNVETSRAFPPESDAELALRLAEEERERQRLFRSQEAQDAAIALRMAQGEDGVGTEVTISPESTQQFQVQPAVVSPTRQEAEDAALARRLAGIAQVPSSEDPDRLMAQRLQDEEVARQTFIREQQSGGTSNFLDERNIEDEDTRRARQIAQEMEDEELARRYSTYDEYNQGVARREARELQQQRHARHGFCIRFFPFICIFLSATVALLFTFNVFDFSNTPAGEKIEDILDFDFDDWIDSDPYEGEVNVTQPGTAYAWSNRGRGLDLKVLNALDQSWQTIFYESMADWEDGTPDALTLTTEVIPYEFDCDPVTGAMKVCNGDYGDTRYRGLNKVLLDRRSFSIYSSAATMNDFYLKRERNAQKRYTMCHELGHGFGLPHWDENFYNRDLGNCMDYTNNPAKNMLPDESNYLFLVDLYGEVQGPNYGGGQGGLSGTNIASTSQNSVIEQEVPKNELEERGGGLRRATAYEHAVPVTLLPVYEDAMAKFHEIVSSSERHLLAEHGWRKFHESEGLESHEFELDSDIVVQVHLLLVA